MNSWYKEIIYFVVISTVVCSVQGMDTEKKREAASKAEADDAIESLINCVGTPQAAGIVMSYLGTPPVIIDTAPAVKRFLMEPAYLYNRDKGKNVKQKYNNATLYKLDPQTFRAPIINMGFSYGPDNSVLNIQCSNPVSNIQYQLSNANPIVPSVKKIVPEWSPSTKTGQLRATYWSNNAQYTAEVIVYDPKIGGTKVALYSYFKYWLPNGEGKELLFLQIAAAERGCFQRKTARAASAVGDADQKMESQ